jgi:hypothetical protein
MFSITFNMNFVQNYGRGCWKSEKETLGLLRLSK